MLSGAHLVTHMSEHRGEQLPHNVLNWTGDYIFAFRSLAIVPMETVKSASLAAVNFHPGPPEFPGSGCTNFALYEESDSFGVTAHLIEEVVDSGRILAFRRFPIAFEDDVVSLTRKTHSELFILASSLIAEALSDYKWIKRISAGGNTVAHWSGTRRRASALNELSNVPPTITAEELEKRVRAFHHPKFPLSVTLHGRRFLLGSIASEENS